MIETSDNNERSALYRSSLHVGLFSGSLDFGMNCRERQPATAALRQPASAMAL